MDLQQHMRDKLVAALVGRCLGICPRTGDTFDVRTAVVLLDRDGDPVAVVSQRGWRDIVADPETLGRLTAAGYSVDPSTEV